MKESHWQILHDKIDVNEFKYLGITLDPQQKFDAHIKTLSKT